MDQAALVGTELPLAGGAESLWRAGEREADRRSSAIAGSGKRVSPLAAL
jgi:hypothetical protein